MIFATLSPNGQLSQQVSMDLSRVPSEDPIAYVAGFNDGYGGKPKARPGRGDSLAVAYKLGYKSGCSHRTGGTKPDWLTCGS